MRPPITAGPMLRAANGLSIAAEGVGRDGVPVSRVASTGFAAGFRLCAIGDGDSEMMSKAMAAARCVNGAS